MAGLTINYKEMNCKEIQLYIDNNETYELHSFQNEKVRNHIKNCGECTLYFQNHIALNKKIENDKAGFESSLHAIMERVERVDQVDKSLIFFKRNLNWPVYGKVAVIGLLLISSLLMGHLLGNNVAKKWNENIVSNEININDLFVYSSDFTEMSNMLDD